MPRVEKVTGGRVYVRGIGRFRIGDQAEVSEDDAAYLCEERGDFRRVEDADEGDGDVDGEDVDDNAVAEGPYRDRDAVDDGNCGFVDPETDSDPCGRGAGWGRDADGGPCKDHVDELED